MKPVEKYFLIAAACAAVIAAASFLIFRSGEKTQVAVLWTDEAEFASYAELFNTSQDTYRVVVTYKPNPVDAFPPAKDDQPDIVVGAWLKNSKIRSNFKPLDYLFGDLYINPQIFYPQLLELGNVQGNQYLLPVSFNLPAIIFSTKNQQFIEDDFMLSLDQIRQAGASFNKQTKNGDYTAIGFSPRWTPDFLYLTAKLKKANFQETETAFSWDAAALKDTIAYLKDWTETVNTSAVTEDDFQFKYLYNPAYKLVTGDRCLFAYLTSNELFRHPREKLQDIEFRWIQENGRISIADRIIYMGLYKKSKHTEAAEAFIIWFMNEATQKALLERSRDMGILDRSFGISNGFSAIKNVNERVFPLFYPLLLGHLPPQETLMTPNILPKDWDKQKEQIVIPYLAEAVVADENTYVIPLEDRLAEWMKRN